MYEKGKICENRTTELPSPPAKISSVQSVCLSKASEARLSNLPFCKNIVSLSGKVLKKSETLGNNFVKTVILGREVSDTRLNVVKHFDAEKGILFYLNPMN